MGDSTATTGDPVSPETVNSADGPDVAFSGKAYPLFKLLLKNTVLTVLTMGIYRFWAKTWLRRYFWNNITIAKESLEYTGQPKELFLGFLIALAVLVPMGIIDNYSTTFLAGYPDLQTPYSILFYGTLFLLFQFAFYRMWRYRMTRTTWRGIHFSLDGSAFKFVFRSLLWTIISVLSLGLASPWSRTALARYRINNSQFGDRYFSFHGVGKDLIAPWLIAYGIPVSLMITWGWLNFEQIADVAKIVQRNPDGTAQMSNTRAMWLIMVAGLAFPLLLIWYKAREFRYFINATRFGGVTLTSTLSSATVVGLFVAAYLLIILLFAGLFGAIFLPSFFLFGTTVNPEALGMIAGGGTAIIFLLVLPLLVQGFLRYQLVKRFCHGLSINNVAELESVAQSTRPAPSRGEGFADALDVGAF